MNLSYTQLVKRPVLLQRLTGLNTLKLGWQSRLDEDILGGSEIGLRIFAKAELQPMLFVSSFKVIPQVIPSWCIVQLESLNTQTLRVGSHSSKHPNRPAHDQTRNRGAACSTSFMPA